MAAINLKTVSTTAKLEEWVSDPQNSQKLIDDLEKKLAQGEMEGLEDYLKDKKLKKSLCLTADDIDKIRNNDELGWFLDVMNDAKVPKSLLDLFFQRNTDYDPSNHLQACEVGEEPSASSSAPSATNKDNEKLRRKEVQERVLVNWAMKQCDGSEKELNKVFEDISIKNVVEHKEYLFLVAENVMVYNKPLTQAQKNLITNKKIQIDERKILVITDEKRNLVRMTNLLHYQMFVSNIHTTFLLSSEEPKEQHIKYNETLVPTNLCLRCISEVFLPALAIFKKIQRKEFSHQKTNE
ncbi:uncharacterized protein LOC134320933 [Trichomycterus rosablanca]|uniref:uncharacterized protein LOC134320933 n=1 Tax=Trichomycterus rosablanca TaxID=2290929 RepID=UPI002F35E5A1